MKFHVGCRNARRREQRFYFQYLNCDAVVYSVVQSTLQTQEVVDTESSLSFVICIEKYYGHNESVSRVSEEIPKLLALCL